MKSANDHIVLLTRLSETSKPRANPTVPESFLPSNPQLKETRTEKRILHTDLRSLMDTGPLPSKPLDTLFTKTQHREAILERLLKSIEMVREVLQYNLQLREQVEELRKETAKQKTELFHLYCENEEQKDKMLILAGMSSVQVSFGSELGEEVKKRVDVAEEIHLLRKDKAMLEQHVHFLEVENAKHKEALANLDKSKDKVESICPLLPKKKNVFIYASNKPIKTIPIEVKNQIKAAYNRTNRFRMHNRIDPKSNTDTYDVHKKGDSYMAQRGADTLKRNASKLKSQKNSVINQTHKTIYNSESIAAKKRCATPFDN